MCDYWRGYDAQRGLEYPSLFDSIAPAFNRLTIFDARLPHGVSPVRGTRAPRRARLVVTGWFSEPQPSIVPDARVLTSHGIGCSTRARACG